MSVFVFLLFGIINIYIINVYSLDNGLAITPPMGWSTWNYYHRNFNETVFYNAVNIVINSGMKSVGYEYINVDGGWWWSVNNTVQRNSSGYAYYSPIKYPNGILNVIDYVHKNGLKYGHYTDAGTNACDGDAQMSQYYMSQDINLFVNEYNIDMIKVDACSVKGNDTEIIFEWRDMLNNTGKPVLFSNCRNQCLQNNWKSWCIGLSNMWRVGNDIQPYWSNMLHNIHNTIGLGQYGQPGAWNDPDFLEVGNGEFEYNGTNASIRINQAHFSLWCIVSAPLIAGNDLDTMVDEILNILINKDAIDINQNYLNHAGDEILQFNGLSTQFIQEYNEQNNNNNNQTELYFKPLTSILGNGAFVYLNMDYTKEYNVTINYNDLPLFNDINHNNTVICDYLNIWTKDNGSNTQYNGILPPQSVIFYRLSNCKYA